MKLKNDSKKEMNIPVFHDDQHGTAIVTVAGLVNALRLVNKSMSEIKVVANGAGAAGIAIIKLLYSYGVRATSSCVIRRVPFMRAVRQV